MISPSRWSLSSALLSATLLCINGVSAQAPQTSTAVYRELRPVFESAVSLRSRNLIRNDPSVADGLVGVVNVGGLIELYGSGQDLAGVEFISQGGLLTPVPIVDGENLPRPDPFEVLLSNSEQRVTYGSLNSTVRVDGRLILSAGYRGNSPEDDLSAVWGRGIEAIPFPVTAFGSPSYSPWNDSVAFEEVVYSAVIEAGSAGGVPPDSPANRVDANVGGQFPGVVSLQVVHPTLGDFICTGSIIDNTHVLTAGHCFDQDSDGAPDAGIELNSIVHINDGGAPSATRGITQVDIHPDFSGFANGANDDFAIATLDSAVPPGTKKYPIRTSGMASGEVLEMVGYGISGFGDVGGVEVLPDYHVKRSGENTADLFVVDDEGSGRDEIFFYDFDGPTGNGLLGGATLGNDIETGVRGGDSGGPALVVVGGELAIAGVNTFEFALSGTTPPPGEFGVLGGGVLIDEPQWLWIKSIATEATPEPSGWALLVPGLSILGTLRRRNRRHGPLMTLEK